MVPLQSHVGKDAVLLGIFRGLGMAGRILFLAGFSLLMAFGIGTSYIAADPEGASELALSVVGASAEKDSLDPWSRTPTRSDPEEAAADRADRIERIYENREYTGETGE